jgi:hypothetical protein
MWGGGKQSLTSVWCLLSSFTVKDTIVLPWNWNIENCERNSNSFYQDAGAPCHRPKTIKDWHTANGELYSSPPPQSPEMNPIENMWHYTSLSSIATGKNLLLTSVNAGVR